MDDFNSKIDGDDHETPDLNLGLKQFDRSKNLTCPTEAELQAQRKSNQLCVNLDRNMDDSSSTKQENALVENNRSNYFLNFLEDSNEDEDEDFNLEHELDNWDESENEFSENPVDCLTDPVEILAEILMKIRFNEAHQFLSRRLHNKINEDDAIELIKNAKNIVVLSGAGISVSCGVPDFRSPGGLYDQVREKYNFANPQFLFDIHFMRQNQAPFYDFAAQLFPSGDLEPSKSHKFIKFLQDEGKLLRNYSQNIDTLEQKVGIQPDKLVLCHGSFATFTCPKGHKVDGDTVKGEILNKIIPQCKVCNDSTGNSFLKPDIVFFGEPLPDRFSKKIKEDINSVDLLIVMGSSLRVQPVALIPVLFGQLLDNVPQLLFNRELVGGLHKFDFTFLYDCNVAVERVCQKLGWKLD